MMLTAGSGSDELWFNDVHALDIGSWKWTKVNPDGTVLPSPRDYASVNVITEKVCRLGAGGDSTALTLVDLLVCSYVWWFQWH